MKEGADHHNKETGLIEAGGKEQESDASPLKEENKSHRNMIRSCPLSCKEGINFVKASLDDTDEG